MRNLYLTLALLSLAACAPAQSSEANASEAPSEVQTRASSMQTDTAIFAGGCFWCVESDYEKLPGVISVVSGYTGGRTDNPTYKEVTYKNTGHYEAVKVTFDPAVISYEALVDYFWPHVDPTDPNGQFCDKGESYRTAIFARPDQLSIASQSKSEIEENKPFAAKIVTPILPATKFYDAEDYHQDYYKKNPLKYKYYRTGCRRDARLKQLWGK